MRCLLPRPPVAAALAATALLMCNIARAADQSMLLSIAGVSLSDEQFVALVSLELHNLRVQAVCHVPSDWSMKVEQPVGMIVDVEGEAGHGASELGTDYLDQLKSLLLVTKFYKNMKLDDSREYKIEGSLIINVRGENPGLVTIPLEPANLVVEPADRCPPPRR